MKNPGQFSVKINSRRGELQATHAFIGLLGLADDQLNHLRYLHLPGRQTLTA